MASRDAPLHSSRSRGRAIAAAALTALVLAVDGSPAFAGPAVQTAACQPDAEQSSGALYRICMPQNPGRWNGDLFVYAHGYVSPLEDVAIPEDQLSLGGVFLPDLLTSLGYAFITTSYAKTGLAIVEGIDDVTELVSIFEAEIGPAGNVYLAGPSEGGAVTALAVERHPLIFNGGLSACGPVGSFRNQINYFGDFRVLFDYFFPGLLPDSPVLIPDELMQNWETVYVPLVTAAVAGNPAAAQQLLAVSGAPIDDADPATVLATIVDVLWYNVFATNDGAAQFGGQPFDNRRRWYRGSANDLALNLGVARFAADQAALETIAEKYETSGDVDVPLVTLHTTGDPIIRYWHEPLYRRKIVASGDDDRHLNLPIKRYGHCAFTAFEALTAFAALVRRVTGEDTSAMLEILPKP